MADFKLFYCWIKLSKRGASGGQVPDFAGIKALDAAREDMKTAGMSPDDMVALASVTFNGGIPPNSLAVGLRPTLLSGGIPPNFRAGGVFFQASWGLDEQFSGKPSSELVVDYAPVAGSRDDATDWLNKHPEWLDASVETYFLMAFAASV